MLPSTNILYLLIKYFKINNTNKKKYTKHQQHQNKIHQIVLIESSFNTVFAFRKLSFS